MQHAVDATQVQSILSKVAETLAGADATALRQQVDSVEVSGGSLTMLELAVDPNSPRIGFRDGILPGSSVLVGAAGSEIGELIVWIADGHVTGLEYAWWSDHAPAALPSVENIRLVPSRTP